MFSLLWKICFVFIVFKLPNSITFGYDFCKQLSLHQTKINVFGNDDKNVLVIDTNWIGYRYRYDRLGFQKKQSPPFSIFLNQKDKTDLSQLFPSWNDVPKNNITNIFLIMGTTLIKPIFWIQYDPKSVAADKTDLAITNNSTDMYWFNTGELPRDVIMFGFQSFQHVWGFKIKGDEACLTKIRFTYKMPKNLEW